MGFNIKVEDARAFAVTEAVAVRYGGTDAYAAARREAVGGIPVSMPCPYCDRLMSAREAVEQGACNDCTGGS